MGRINIERDRSIYQDKKDGVGDSALSKQWGVSRVRIGQICEKERRIEAWMRKYNKPYPVNKRAN